jgi:hypothetical protein
MDQQKDHTLALIIVLLVLAVLIAGAIYFWQNGTQNDTDVVIPAEDITDGIDLDAE